MKTFQDKHELRQFMTIYLAGTTERTERNTVDRKVRRKGVLIMKANERVNFMET